MKIVFYCQHVLGMGHYFRSLEIIKALAAHEVVFVVGGPPAPAAPPEGVRVVRLPALEMDANFTALAASEAAEDLESLKALRRERLLALFERERPDVFFVELYPFGRKAFEFELLPVLTGIRQGRFGEVSVVCGLRDILVEKANREKFETRALSRLNDFFDALLVHADPTLFPLDETFSRMDGVNIPVAYTGYVAQDAGKAKGGMREALGVAPGRRLVAVSAGGGKVGGEVLRAVLEAGRLLEREASLSLRLFTGPFATDEDFEALRTAATGLADAVVARFSEDFPSILAEADLSVSMAGYNTVMAILRAGTPALVRPFDQNREQRLRAERLAERGLLGVLDEADLAPATLAGRMAEVLAKRRGDGPGIDLDGAAKTARWLEDWTSRRLSR